MLISKTWFDFMKEKPKSVPNLDSESIEYSINIFTVFTDIQQIKYFSCIYIFTQKASIILNMKIFPKKRPPSYFFIISK